MFGVVVVDVAVGVIVEAHHVYRPRAAVTPTRRRWRSSPAGSGRACGRAAAGPRRPVALRPLPSIRPLFIAERPQKYARVVAVRGRSGHAARSWPAAPCRCVGFSSSTSMPSRSQASSNSGVGGLCEVRIAFDPMSFNRLTRKDCIASGRATPTPPASWWSQVPLISTWPAVEEEPVVFVEPQRANAEHRVILVDHDAVLFDRRHQRVQHRRLDRPEPGLRNGQFCRELLGVSRTQCDAMYNGTRDRFAGVVQHRLVNVKIGRAGRIIFESLLAPSSRPTSPIAHRLRCPSPSRRSQTFPSAATWTGSVLFSPHMSIQAGTFVEPAFFQGCIEPNDQRVRAAVIQDVREVAAEAVISARTSADIEPI